MFLIEAVSTKEGRKCLHLPEKMSNSLKLALLPGPSTPDTFSFAGGRWQKFAKLHLCHSSHTLSCTLLNSIEFGGVVEVTFIEGLLWTRHHAKDFKFLISSHLLQNLFGVGVRISFLLIRYQIITFLVT